MERLTGKEIRELFLHPERMTKETLARLRETVSDEPCFHAARILLLENMLAVGDDNYGQELKRAGFFLPCEDRLSEIIDDAMKRRQTGNLANDRTMNILNEFLGVPDESDSVGELPFFSPIQTDYLVAAGLGNSREEFGGELDDAIGSFIDTFLKDSSQSAEDTVVPLQVPEDEATEKQSEVHVDTIGDDEISDISDSSLNNELFTETLAAIYIKQHRYEEALEIIRYLYLNFPNKSCYFADQIRFLELITGINKQKR